MRHNPNCLTSLPISECNNDVILAGLAAEEVDGVVFCFGFGVEGGDEHVGGVVDADDGLAFVVAEVEAVDVVAAEDDGLAVHGVAFTFVGSGEAHHELSQVDGAFACFAGTILYAFFAVVLDHGYQGESQYDSKNGP